MENTILSLEYLVLERGVADMPHGQKEDAFGHAVEMHCCAVCGSNEMLRRYLDEELSESNLDDRVFKQVIESGLFGNIAQIVDLSATLNMCQWGLNKAV